jgi:hypothetical protein
VGGLLWLLLLSLRPRGFLSKLRHHLIVFRPAATRRCICWQAAHPMRHVRDPLAGRPLPAHDDREKHARHRKADLIVIMARPSRILVSSDSRVSIGGLIERWYYVIEGWSNPRAWTILDARGRSPMCDRVASPLLGRGAGGAPPATSSRLSGPTEVSAEWTSRVRIWHL